jgi:hypothetical protein
MGRWASVRVRDGEPGMDGEDRRGKSARGLVLLFFFIKENNSASGLTCALLVSLCERAQLTSIFLARLTVREKHSSAVYMPSVVWLVR